MTNDGKIVPVYATAKSNKALAFSITFNGKVITSELGSSESGNLITNDDNTVHFAAPYVSSVKEPIAFIKIDSDEELVAEKVIVNDVNLGKEIIGEESGVTGSVAAYPNPFDQEVMVSIPAEFKGGVMTVSDVNGKVIGTFSINQETMTLNAFTGKPAGVYTITMKNGLKSANTVIIKR
jgi:peptidoglycan hydrolase-like amidase